MSTRKFRDKVLHRRFYRGSESNGEEQGRLGRADPFYGVTKLGYWQDSRPRASARQPAFFGWRSRCSGTGMGGGMQKKL